MKCWILTHIIFIQISFNNYGKNVIMRISFSTYIIWNIPRFIHNVVSGTSRHGQNFGSQLQFWYTLVTYVVLNPTTITTTIVPKNSVMTQHNHMWLDRNEIISRCIKLTYIFFLLRKESLQACRYNRDMY